MLQFLVVVAVVLVVVWCGVVVVGGRSITECIYVSSNLNPIQVEIALKCQDEKLMVMTCILD